MPIVNIKIAGKMTKEKKKELGEKVSAVIAEVTGKPPQYISVHIEDTERENWTADGKQLE